MSDKDINSIKRTIVFSLKWKSQTNKSLNEVKKLQNDSFEHNICFTVKEVLQ